MTTLQEAARDALEALERIGKDFVCRSAHHAKKDQHSAFAECPVVVRHTDAIESLKAALAQQDDTVTALRSQVEYLEKIVEDQAKALAQHGEQAKPAAYITDTEQGPMVWTPEMYDEACTYCDDGEFPVPLYTAAPAPQEQPMTDPCKTCSHFQEGNLPGVRIHDETCYECRSYWGNKWEAA